MKNLKNRDMYEEPTLWFGYTHYSMGDKSMVESYFEKISNSRVKEKIEEFKKNGIPEKEELIWK